MITHFPVDEQKSHKRPQPPALYPIPILQALLQGQSFPLSCLLELLAIEFHVHRITETSRTMLVSLIV